MKKSIVPILAIVLGLGGMTLYQIGSTINGTMAGDLQLIGQVCLGIFALWLAVQIWVMAERSEAE